MSIYFMFEQAWRCSPDKEVAWNLLSLFTASGILCLEISLMAFVLKDNYTNGMEVIANTFLVSGIIVIVDILLKVIPGFRSYLFKTYMHVLFILKVACLLSF